MKMLLGVLMALQICSQTYAAVYRWVDKNGEVHFSDQPHKGAEQVNLPPVQTYSPPKESPAPQEVSDKPSSEVDSVAYDAVQIIQPTQEATLRNNQGLVPVSVDFSPKLRQSDKVQLFFDGKPIGEPENTTNFTLTNVYRGAHTVSVTVYASDGTELNSSESVTFFMHRPRVGMGRTGGR